MTNLTATRWERKSNGMTCVVIADDHASTGESNRLILLRAIESGRTFWGTPGVLHRKYAQIADDWPLSIPDGLTADGLNAARTINAFLAKNALTEFGGGSRFYSPEQWKERGEAFGNDAALVITHDGGDAASAFDPTESSDVLRDELQRALAEHDLFAEPANSWCSAIYHS